MKNRKDFRLTILKEGKSGTSIKGCYFYDEVDPNWMKEEVKELQSKLYRKSDGWILEVDEVKSK